MNEAERVMRNFHAGEVTIEINEKIKQRCYDYITKYTDHISVDDGRDGEEVKIELFFLKFITDEADLNGFRNEAIRMLKDYDMDKEEVEEIMDEKVFLSIIEPENEEGIDGMTVEEISERFWSEFRSFIEAPRFRRYFTIKDLRMGLKTVPDDDEMCTICVEFKHDTAYIMDVTRLNTAKLSAKERGFVPVSKKTYKKCVKKGLPLHRFEKTF